MHLREIGIRLVTVSYTHLDVYKRQGHERMVPADSAPLFKAEQSGAAARRIWKVYVGISALRIEQTQVCDRWRKRELASRVRVSDTRQVAQCLLDMLCLLYTSRCV